MMIILENDEKNGRANKNLTANNLLKHFVFLSKYEF